MSKDLLVLADEYAAATATFARALALKDEADSMSPIAREAGDKRAVLAEALAALDTVRPVQVNAMLVEALEKLLPMARRHGTLFSSSNPWTEACDIGDAALTAAKQAQPERAPSVDKRLLRLQEAVIEMYCDWKKGDFALPRLAQLDLEACFEAANCGEHFAAIKHAQPEPVNAMLVEAGVLVDEIDADLGYIFGRIKNDDRCQTTIAADVRDKLKGIRAALTAAKQAQPPAPSKRSHPHQAKQRAST